MCWHRASRRARGSTGEIRAAITIAARSRLPASSRRLVYYVTASTLSEEREAAMVNRGLAAVRRMFSLAAKAGKLPSRPCIAMLVEDNAREGFTEAAESETMRARLPAYLANVATYEKTGSA